MGKNKRKQRTEGNFRSCEMCVFPDCHNEFMIICKDAKSSNCTH